MGFRLEAVVVSVNYADFLEHTLTENLQHFDHVVVVTTPADKATQALCERLSVDCVTTEVFYERGAVFNKGRGIRMGFSHLPQEKDTWLMHVDADILLPHRLRNMLEFHARLNTDFIYGADRINVFGYEAWEKNRARLLSPQFSYRCLVNPPTNGISLGARLVHNELGYCPIGYFQLWHSSQRKLYPINSGSAEHGDVLFAAQWPREKRALLPELFVVHLDSEKEAKMGLNWRGRKSKPFGKEERVRLAPNFGNPDNSNDGHRHKPHHHHHDPCHHHHHHGPYSPWNPWDPWWGKDKK